MITIVLSPKFRKYDVQNIFSDPERYGKVLFLPGIKNSKILAYVFFLFINLLKVLINKEIHLWVSDIYIQYLSNINILKLKRKNIHYFSMNAEFDLLKYGLHEIEKNNHLLFKNSRWNYLYPNKNNNSKLIYYFGELELDSGNIVDSELFEYYNTYINEANPSNLVAEIDLNLINIFKNRELGNFSYYKQLISVKNAQRYYYLKLISNNFKGTYFMGSDLQKYGIQSAPSRYSRDVVHKNILTSTINLDLGSKSFFECEYPRSLLIKSINPGSIFQLSQSEIYNHEDRNTFINNDVISKLKKKIRFS
jgi:hypothetical protein